MLQLLLLIVLLEALFFNLGLSFEICLAVGALVVLLACQIYFITRRIRVKGEQSSIVEKPVAKQTQVKKKTATQKAAVTTNIDQLIDPEVFSKFQKNLSQTQDSALPSSKKSADEDDDVVVSISASTKRLKKDKKPSLVPPIKKTVVTPGTRKTGIKTAQKKTLPKLDNSIEVASIGSLFDDVREPLDQSPDDTRQSSKTVKPKKKEVLAEAEPLISNEFLSSDDLEPNSENPLEGIDLALSASQNEFQEGKYEEALATIRQFLQTQNQNIGTSDPIRQLVKLKGDCEYALKQFERSSKTWQDIFIKHIKKDHPDFLPLLEEFIQKYVVVEEQKHAVHFLFTALNEYRQNHEHPKMDLAYHEIENAYRQTEDWPRLIQTYQNHLTIKKVLKDYTGQLDILDHLGKLLYDQGDAENSRKCYEQRLTIENEMAKINKQ